LSSDASAFAQDTDEKKADQVDSTDVVLRISISATGVAKRVDILSDPGNGFGEEAKRYALAQHYRPALDRAGVPTEGSITVRVHFQRSASP
jgi:hypothetical protein